MRDLKGFEARRLRSSPDRLLLHRLADEAQGGFGSGSVEGADCRFKGLGLRYLWFVEGMRIEGGSPT